MLTLVKECPTCLLGSLLSVVCTAVLVFGGGIISWAPEAAIAGSIIGLVLLTGGLLEKARAR